MGANPNRGAARPPAPNGVNSLHAADLCPEAAFATSH